MQPPTMPINGPQRRHTAEPRRVSPATMTKVASAVKGAATGSDSVDRSNRPKTTEAKVMESIIIIVPPTVGVTILRRMNSHFEIMS